MRHTSPRAILALLPLAHAQLGNLQERGAVEECCPCPVPGTPNEGPETITVTEAAGPAKTVTVYFSQGVQYDPPTATVTVTQTVTEQGSTVYVTKEAGHDYPGSGGYGPGDDGDHYVITKTITPADGSGGKKTITLKEVGDYTITARPSAETAADKVETVTRTVTVDGGQNDVEVIIIDHKTGKSTCHRRDSGLPCHSHDDDDDGQYPAPPAKGNEYPIPTGNKYPDTDNSGYPDPDGNGYPAPSGNGYPLPAGCDSVKVSTSITTVYNTVVITVNPEATTRPVSSTEEGSSARNKREAKIPRGPALGRWW